jgi:hypothetical protein
VDERDGQGSSKDIDLRSKLRKDQEQGRGGGWGKPIASTAIGMVISKSPAQPTPPPLLLQLPEGRSSSYVLSSKKGSELEDLWLRNAMTRFLWHLGA